MIFQLAASALGSSIDKTFLLIITIDAFLLSLITLFMIYCVIRYSRKRNPIPTNIPSNTILEVTWVVVPTIIALVIFYYGWIAFKVAKNIPKNAMPVKVTGRMWSWLFEYENGVASDILNVPAGKPIKLEITSQDVTHSLYIPAFRIKQDAVPGAKNYMWFMGNRPGTYDIECAEYCGLGHSAMLSRAVVMPEDEFNKWYEGEKLLVAKPPVSKEKAGASTLAALGEKLIKTKGCVACHTLDGSKSIAPTFKGIFGRTSTVITSGKERTVAVDEEYIRLSMLEPTRDVVKDFPPVMPSQKGLVTEDEIKAIIEFLKTVR